MNLTRNQMTVLTILLDGDKYGLEVIQEAKESGVHLLLGSFYNVTTTLEKKGLVKSYEGKTTDERGGNNRRYYKITAAGEYELRNYVSGLSKFLNWINPKLNINLSGALLFLLLLIPSSMMAANSGGHVLVDTFIAALYIVFFCIMFFPTLFLIGIAFIILELLIWIAYNVLKFLIYNSLRIGIVITVLYLLYLIVSIGIAYINIPLEILPVILIGFFLSKEKYAVKIITYFGYIIPRKRRKEIVGDLLEDYHQIRKEKNSVFAILVTIFHMVSLARISVDRAKFSDYGSEVDVEDSKTEREKKFLHTSVETEEFQKTKTAELWRLEEEALRKTEESFWSKMGIDTTKR